ncbi:MAG TPA: FAD-dependent oxidoreductase [Terriglobales bacterium]|nr:FAD-dependent oxidoreductase [Terriglobales bacterium]
MNGQDFDVVIVGAGVVGAACARECSLAAMRVAVVEEQMIGGGATAAGMGHIVVMDDSEPQFALTRYSQLLWRELLPQLPREVEYESCGTIWVAADQEEMQAVASKHAFYRARGVPAEVLDAHQLTQAEPQLRAGLAGGLLVPEDAVLYPPAAATWLLSRARSQGAVLQVGRKVTQITGEGVHLSDGSWIRAGVVVNATGAWAPSLTPGLQVRKRKGHLVITDRYPGFLRHQLVELGYLKSAHSVTADSVAFNVQPRITGQILIGSSRQYGNEDTTVDRQIVRAMLERASAYMPAIGNLNAIRCWTGFRAATPDKLPLIGPSAKRGILLATGHEGLGITTSLATGRLIADQLLHRPPAIPLEPYLPARAELEVAHA